jgi:hypothetical protein
MIRIAYAALSNFALWRVERLRAAARRWDRWQRALERKAFHD